MGDEGSEDLREKTLASCSSKGDVAKNAPQDEQEGSSTSDPK